MGIEKMVRNVCYVNGIWMFICSMRMMFITGDQLWEIIYMIASIIMIALGGFIDGER